ncbi:MAG: hypothetical protein ABH844_07330 [Candidatus Omnitrophota bacterium]
MFIKRKHLSVILFSSIVITVVFVCTLLGYMLYIQWKKDSYALNYSDSICKLTAELFEKDIVLSNVRVKVEEKESFPDVPFIEGSIKNNSNKVVTSILIEASFLKSDGTVVYKDWFCPLGERFARQNFGAPVLFSSIRETINVLMPGESLPFRHVLKNCPREIISQFFSRMEFARNNSEGKIKLVYSISGIGVL